MSAAAHRFFVLTGGPGAGKSTLLAALSARGFAVAPEAGRAVIRRQAQIDGTALPWRDRLAFAEAMLAQDMRAYQEMAAADGPVFFDRGIPDVAGYLTLCGLPVPAHVARACAELRYASRVFIAPPWREIYANDAERRQDWGEAVRTHAAMARIYADLGYGLLALPHADVEARVRFVLSHAASAA
ncbi:AAA family ATPase [Xanthobacter pseudotagetidis]|uniref:AAA family ATPase n=1 Tax=Xanthobacter pseudotagetidis TaxID=3119911 RepID=UPI003729AEDE